MQGWQIKSKLVLLIAMAGQVLLLGGLYLVADGTSGTVTIGVPTSTNSDIEITDATKGVIFKAPTGQRVRMTMTVVNGTPAPVYTVL